jgi:hypothetical protein
MGRAGLLEDKLCPDAVTERTNTMNAEEKVSWLNEHEPRRKWAVGDDVRCRNCDGGFKAEKVVMDFVGDPTCPFCISSTTADFVNDLRDEK